MSSQLPQRRKRVAIVGSGIGGLACIKSCLEEGLEPVCFEQFDKIGGVWNFTDEYIPGQGGSVYDTLHTNVSKNMMCLSDFPMSPEADAYPSYREVYHYIKDYANHFDLIPYIKFLTTVVSVKKSRDYDVTGNWDVTYLRRSDVRVWERFDTSDMKVETFNSVMVCNGRHALPNQPYISGQDTYTGVFLHSIKYRSANTPEFWDRTVLVVGNAHSAGDIALASSNYAAKTIISLGRGTWIIPKFLPNGLPLDFSLRRALSFVPEAVQGFIMKRMANSAIDHAKYHIAPPGEPLHSTIMVSQDLPMAIKDGRVDVKPMLVGFDGNIAMFSDGTEEEVDTVVMATGFEYDYSFLDVGGEGKGEIHTALYRQMWPGTLPHASAALIGCLSIRGAAVPSLELQARWAARVFAGHAQLPDNETMLKEAKERTLFMRAWFGRDRLVPAPNNLAYQDALADEIGAKPSFFKLFFKSPYLAFLSVFGPAFPVQYRLLGPHAWDGAPAAAKEAYGNTARVCPNYKTNVKDTGISLKMITAVGLCCLTVCLFVFGI